MLVKKLALKMVIIGLSVYVIAITFIYVFQDKFIFQSSKLPENYEFKFTIPFDEYFIETNDSVKVNALHFKTESKITKGLVIYFHGNADNLQRWGKYAKDFTQLGYDVLIIDYRGYGKSTGISTEIDLYNDAEFIWSWAKNKFDYSKWIIYGRSLGAAIASHLATEVSPDLLGLETPFDDLNGAIVGYLVPYKFKYKFATKEHLSKVKCKKFIFHGTQDWLVPLWSALRLKPLLKETDQIIIIPKGRHKNLSEFDKYHKKLKDFLL